MAWENATNEDLFIAICALRLDRNCSADTFVSVVEEVERRLEDSVSKKDIIHLVAQMRSTPNLSTSSKYWANKFEKLTEK